MKLLLIDNYDSFTYNLYHYMEDLGAEITVWRNDGIDMTAAAGFDAFVISPGPGLPHESGRLMELVSHFASQKPMLGICLGLQALAVHFGGELVNLQIPKHGISRIAVFSSFTPINLNLPRKIEVGLYHSWGVSPQNPGKGMEVFGTSDEGVIMAARHQTLPLYGVQFHPESVMTPLGKKLLKNWLDSL